MVEVTTQAIGSCFSDDMRERWLTPGAHRVWRHRSQVKSYN